MMKGKWIDIKKNTTFFFRLEKFSGKTIIVPAAGRRKR